MTMTAAMAPGHVDLDTAGSRNMFVGRFMLRRSPLARVTDEDVTCKDRFLSMAR